MKARRAVLWSIGGLAATGAGLGTYAFGVEPFLRLVVQRHRVTPAGWPAGLTLRVAAQKGIAHLADRLRGTTIEEIEADAEQLLQLLPAQPHGAQQQQRDPGQGKAPSKPGGYQAGIDLYHKLHPKKG